MASHQSESAATELLQGVSQRPEVANGVNEAEIISNETETAVRISTTTLHGNDSYREVLLPASDYISRAEGDAVFDERANSDHRPSDFYPLTLDTIDVNVSAVECSDCAGEGTNECWDCRGKSVVSCPNSECNGGRVICDNCDGNEQIECALCEGFGDLGCDLCDSSGSQTCDECYGDGTITCSTCKSGLLSSKPAGKVRCPDCKGNGEKRTMDGTVACPSCTNGYRTCTDCNGSKSRPCTNCGRAGSFTCSACNGAGQNPCSACARTGLVNCDECTHGTQTCSICEGETTVPCGCGDGRITCDTCTGDGDTVTTLVGTVSYTVNNQSEIESELGVEEAHIEDDRFTDDNTVYEIEQGDFVDSGNWVERKRVRRQELPVRKVTYQYANETYSILDVGGNIVLESYPESETLSDFRSTLTERRRQLRSETSKRRDYFREMAKQRVDRIKSHAERTSMYRGIMQYGFYLLTIVALYGAYLFVTS